MNYRIIKLGIKNVGYKIESDRGGENLDSKGNPLWYPECDKGYIIYWKTFEEAEKALEKLIEEDKEKTEEIVKEVKIK